MLDIRIAQTQEEREAVYRSRYSIYVEEMGRYHDRADHGRRTLSDPEDDWSWIVYAIDDGDVVASTRMTWGGDGFSDRQIEQYGLEPFLAELPADVLSVGERTMIVPGSRGVDFLGQLADVLDPVSREHGVLVVFGACEPHLISYYCRFQRPYGTRNINSPEAGYLIPLCSLVQGPEPLEGVGDGRGLPRCIQSVFDGTGTVSTPMLKDPAAYWLEVHDSVHPLDPPVFDGFTDDELQRCTARSNIIRCAEGDRVLKKGGAARNVFIVLSGALEVTDGEHSVAALLPGDVFGETAYLLQTCRTFNVDALTDDTRILSLSERTLRNLTDDDPVVAAKLLGNISKILCRRLAKAG